LIRALVDADTNPVFLKNFFPKKNSRSVRGAMGFARNPAVAKDRTGAERSNAMAQAPQAVTPTAAMQV
jgi:hypothetical protein